MSPSALSAKSFITGIKGSTNGIIMDDLDGRTRNAKAQKRHREKQKARVKALEENVQVLTVQLEDARRQLGQLPYQPGSSRLPITPHSPEFAQLQSENSYLRDENADLRRQLYSSRVSYGGAAQDGSGQGQGPAQGQAGAHSPPHRHGSGQGQGRGPNDNSMQSTPNPDGTSAASSSSSFQPPLDHYSQTPRGSRSRVLSASSAPSASPYATSSSFPADLRAHSLSNSNNQSTANSTAHGNGNSNNGAPTQVESRYPVRYDPHMYPPTAPPPHALPRSQMYNVDNMQYGRGQDDGMPWGPESGPPPFAGGMSYPGVHFSHEGGSSANHSSEPWRSEH